MVTVTLTKPDIGLFADFAATRLEIDHLVVADPDETYDEVAVHFDSGDLPSWPVGYRGLSVSGTVQCTARFVHTEHDRLVQLIGLFRTARTAADARLLLRTNHGLAAGLDELLVGTVPQWSRPHILGQAWDISFTLQRRQFTVEAS